MFHCGSAVGSRCDPTAAAGEAEASVLVRIISQNDARTASVMLPPQTYTMSGLRGMPKEGQKRYPRGDLVVFDISVVDDVVAQLTRLVHTLSCGNGAHRLPTCSHMRLI